MSSRPARHWTAFLLVFLWLLAPAMAAGPARTVVTTENGDYFGFDLRSEQNLSLEQCKAVCLGDPGCRAFTYNTKARWCFLKSDFNKLKPFAGAIAGKVVEQAVDPDIGAPPELTYFPAWMADEARQYRSNLASGAAVGRRQRARPVCRSRRLRDAVQRPAHRDAELYRGRRHLPGRRKSLDQPR